MTPLIEFKGSQANQGVPAPFMENQINLYFNQYIPNGFPDIKALLFSNNADKMYHEAHK